jgi:hypothetical protein
MQSSQEIMPSRFLLLSPAGMAVAFAVLAFLRGLFAWPLLLLLKAHMASQNWVYRVRIPDAGKPGGPGQEQGPIQGFPLPGASPPSGPPGFPPMPGGPHGYMMGPEFHHTMGDMISPFTYVLIWLATIVVAAAAGALLAWIYNLVVARSERTGAKAAA